MSAPRTGRLVALAALGVVVSAAVPAFAHEEINPKRVIVGQPTFLTLTAANEKSVALNGVVITAPQGLPFGSAIRTPPGWTSARSEAKISYTGGVVAPERFESFGFEIEGADQPGTYTYAIELQFAGAASEQVKVPVTAVTSEPPSATPTSPSATTPASSSPSASIAPPVTLTPAPVRDTAARSRGTTALVLGGAGALLGLIALVVALARGRSGDRTL